MIKLYYIFLSLLYQYYTHLFSLTNLNKISSNNSSIQDIPKKYPFFIYEQYKNILLVALITATLVLGTSVIPLQSYAGENKNTEDSKSSIKVGTVLDKKSASQNLDQDNFLKRRRWPTGQPGGADSGQGQ